MAICFHSQTFLFQNILAKHGYNDIKQGKFLGITRCLNLFRDACF